MRAPRGVAGRGRRWQVLCLPHVPGAGQRQPSVPRPCSWASGLGAQDAWPFLPCCSRVLKPQTLGPPGGREAQPRQCLEGRPRSLRPSPQTRREAPAGRALPAAWPPGVWLGADMFPVTVHVADAGLRGLWSLCPSRWGSPQPSALWSGRGPPRPAAPATLVPPAWERRRVRGFPGRRGREGAAAVWILGVASGAERGRKAGPAFREYACQTPISAVCGRVWPPRPPGDRAVGPLLRGSPCGAPVRFLPSHDPRILWGSEGSQPPSLGWAWEEGGLTQPCCPFLRRWSSRVPLWA